MGKAVLATVRCLLAGVGVLAATGAARATLPPIPRQVVCPLTGEAFEFTGDYASFTSFGRSLDFEPLVMGMLRRSPRHVPQCRDSGLPLYRAFTPAEVEKLRTMVATPAWAERRAADSVFYLVAYTKSVLGDDELSIAESLLQAVWGAADGNRMLLLAKAIDAWSHVADTRPQHDANWVAAHWLRVDLNRQRGTFEEADYWLRDFVQRLGASHSPVSDGMIGLERQLIAARNADPAAAPRNEEP